MGAVVTNGTATAPVAYSTPFTALTTAIVATPRQFTLSTWSSGRPREPMRIGPRTR